MLANPAKAKQKLGWQPELSFEQLVHRMVDEDVKTQKLQGHALGRRRDMGEPVAGSAATGWLFFSPPKLLPARRSRIGPDGDAEAAELIQRRKVMPATVRNKKTYSSNASP